MDNPKDAKELSSPKYEISCTKSEKELLKMKTPYQEWYDQDVTKHLENDAQK